MEPETTNFDPTPRMWYLRGVWSLCGKEPGDLADIVRRPGDDSRPPRPRIPRPRPGRSLGYLAPARRRADCGHHRPPPHHRGAGDTDRPLQAVAADRRGGHG